MAVLRLTPRRRGNTWLKGLLRLWFVIWVTLLLSGPDLSAQPTAPSEYQIKAVFLFNFAQFVDWPTNAFPDEQAPLVIGVIGDDPFGAYLDETIRDEKVNNRPLIVQRYRRLDDIKTCHILFISRSGAGRLEPILSRSKERSVLTVADTVDFARKGGMIQFVVEKNKLRLKINMEAAKAANLNIRSKLLRLAEIATPGKD